MRVKAVALFGVISIHALREEGDLKLQYLILLLGLNFNPRPPRGGRPYGVHPNAEWSNFNPRPPRGGRLCRKRFYLNR